MTITRQEKIIIFKEFYDNSKEIFEGLVKKNKHHKKLSNLYAFNICPGGWDGGINEKVIDIFYGNRPIDIRKEVREDFRVQEVIESASGAALHYLRTDNGNIICYLYPARSENQRPIEDFYLIDYISNPKKLKSKAKVHIKKLISYMETTCIDGEPNLYHRLNVFILRNFNQYVQSGILKENRFKSLFKWLAKYTLTVGLSGFVILIVTWIKDGDTLNNTYKVQVNSYEKLNEIKQESTKSVNQQIEANKKISSLVNKNNATNNKLDTLINQNNEANKSLADITNKVESLRDNVKSKTSNK